MLNHPLLIQGLTGIDSALQGQEPQRRHPLPIKINRHLALQGVALQDAAGDVVQPHDNHLLKEAADPAGNIALISAQQVGNVKAPPASIGGQVGLALLNPEIGDQEFQRRRVGPDCSDDGR